MEVLEGHGLIEFQPVLANRVLFYVNNGGNAFAVDAKTGKLKWRRKVASLNASSPAWNAGRVFIATLKPGAIVALNAKNGHRIWKKSLPSRAESSPIVVNGTVYFGSEDGTVYAYRAKDGRKVWTYHAGGAVKAGLAFLNGTLYFGDYAGAVTALRASNGSKVWSTGTSGASFGRSGQFYSTPAVAFGRVYLGNTDSFVYSFVASNGHLAWRHGTGNYVYAAPAVGDVPQLGPTVFIGSYDGNFYALDARSGQREVDPPRRRPDLRRADRRRQGRLLLEPRPQGHFCPRRAQWQAEVEVPARGVQPGDLRRQAGLPHHELHGVGARA